jgi:hypothetical protein
MQSFAAYWGNFIKCTLLVVLGIVIGMGADWIYDNRRLIEIAAQMEAARLRQPPIVVAAPIIPKSVPVVAPIVPIDLKPKSPAPVSEPVAETQICTGEPDNFRWRVPEGVTSVKLRILSRNGTFQNEYPLSSYIEMKPGQQFNLITSE